MFSEFKPYITSIIFSPTLLLLIIAIGIWGSGKLLKLGRSIAFFSTTILWIFATPFFSTWLDMNLLNQYLPANSETLKLHGVQAIVVLGGGVDAGQPDGIQQLIPTALDRLRHGIELSRNTSIPILVTGGKGWGAKDGSKNESEISKRVARETFKYEINWTESESRDTKENALNSKKLLSQKGIHKIALVTHAWHMPRSHRAFEKAGFEVLPAPMGFTVKRELEILAFLPNGSSLQSTFRTFKEFVAHLAQS